jgi:hypothetical protein
MTNTDYTKQADFFSAFVHLEFLRLPAATILALKDTDWSGGCLLNGILLCAS